MFRLYACLANEHDGRFISLAIAVCLLTSVTAFAVAARTRDLSRQDRVRHALLLGVLSGAGIWTTHFIAMLAYQLWLPSQYLIAPTVASIGISVIMASLGWWLSLKKGRLSFAMAAAMFTLGVGLMHFIGMEALVSQGRILYDASFVALSALGSFGAIAFAMHWRHRWPSGFPAVPAALLTLGICALHFGAMAAATVIPSGVDPGMGATIGRETLAILVAVCLLPLFGAGVAVALLNRRLAGLAQVAAELASHDPLTGAVNTIGFTAKLKTAIQDSHAQDEAFALLYLDIHRFSAINSLNGQLVGDALLVGTIAKVQAVCSGAPVARFGADKFAIVLALGSGARSAGEVAERLIEAMGAPLVIDGKAIVASLNIGIAYYPEDASEAKLLCRKAELALYRAKSIGAGVACRFDKALDTVAPNRHRLEADLPDALAKAQFSLHYQPIVCVETGGVLGFEALLRWHHPDFGNIPPSTFIPLAETGGDKGLMMEIGSWVLREACHEAQSWEQPLKIAVNLSPTQFADRDLVRKVRAVLDSSGLDPTRLELEITEGLLIENTEQALSVLREIKSWGVSIAMDDFGTGFASLSYFRQFPFDKVKIDQSFIRDMAENRQSMAVVKAVIGLSKALDMLVLAEGVETVNQLEILAAEGCSQVQGYLIGRPAPAASFDRETRRQSMESHKCGSRCDQCLERLRPPSGIRAMRLPLVHTTLCRSGRQAA
ncbi:EAL domain-containing protein [Sphingomonas sp. 1P06PA]|uniref:putative bifunctional diguanylate cyclase/phosphodiesterase n=1 Tax=Sphingomonas sp. 1P06PA TaxID=554121 RepID=UPI0039A4E6F2